MTSHHDAATAVRQRPVGGPVHAPPASPAGDRAGDPERTVLLPRVATDPVDELVERVRPQLGRAVDALQVAAALEAAGHTDRTARVEYGYTDVFAVASEVFRRLRPAPAANDGSRGGGVESAAADQAAIGWREGLRPISHGPLLVLPSAAFPAVLAAVGRPGLVLGLVLAGTLGWVYSGLAGYSAHRLLGQGRPGSAGRLLRTAAWTGPALGVALGAALLPHGGPALAGMVVFLLAYQMASTLLVFYRRESWLAVTMVPAFLAGTAYLLSGGATSRWLAVVAAAVGVVAAFGAALWSTRPAAAAEEPASRESRWPPAPTLLGVGGYGLCSAVLLFHAQAPYLLDRLDVAVAAAPLFLSMGFVEWRISRFRPEMVALTRRARRPAAFVAGVWRTIGREFAVCLAVPAVLAAVLLAGLGFAGRLSAAGAVMAAAHVALTGAYYLAFLLASRGRYGWLCFSMAIAVALHIGIGALLGVAPLLNSDGAALADTSLHLGSILLLQALFVLGLLPVIGQIRHYR